MENKTKTIKKVDLIVIVAPSGTGKSTLIKRIHKEFPLLLWSVSATTRPMRPGEVDGVDYHFINREQFEQKINDNEFIEWAKVHQNFYGTLKSALDENIKKNKLTLLDLDVQGCLNLKSIYPDNSVIIFIAPPTIEELNTRLRKRGTENTDIINIRLLNAKEEIKYQDHFDHKIINDDLEKAYSDLKSLISLYYR